MKQLLLGLALVVFANIPAMASAYSYPGTILANRTTEMAFRVSGPLVAVKVDAGMAVKKGQLLMQIDRRDFKDNIAVLEAQLGGAKAGQLLAKRNFERAETLFRQEVSASADFDRAKSTFDSAFSGVRTLEAQLRIARNQLSDCSLNAPYDAVVIERKVENYEMVPAGQVVIALQDIAQMKVEIKVPESAVVNQQLRRGAEAEFELNTLPGKRFKATLVEWSPSADPVTRTYALQFEFDAPDDVQVLPGMTAEVFYADVDR